MWIIALPMFILLAITPMLLLSKDLLIESQQQSAAQIARVIQIQQRAVVDYCEASFINCLFEKTITYASFEPYLDKSNRDGELFKKSGGIISKTSFNGRKIITMLSTKDAASPLRTPPTSMIQYYWVEQKIAGAGLYNSSLGSIIDSYGSQFSVSLPASDNNAPVLVCDKNGSNLSAC